MELIWQISIHSRWEVGDNFANLVVIIGKSGKETAIFELCIKESNFITLSHSRCVIK